MSEVRDFLDENERLRDKITCFDPELSVKYTIFTLDIDGEEAEDDVILEIKQNTEPCILIGGSELEIRTLSGLGRISVLDLTSGAKKVLGLEPGVEVEIPSNNTLYWYENLGPEPLLVRDHSDNFDYENEPTLKKVVEAFINFNRSL